MAASQKSPARARPKRRVLFAVQILLAAMTGLSAFRIWSINGGQVWKLFAGLFIFMMVSLILRLGWIVPCMVVGTLTGAFLDPMIKGGTIESQMWETVRYICGGAIVGLVLGLVIDGVCAESQYQNDKKPDATDQNTVSHDGARFEDKTHNS
ncbi:MAG: hypothetical protein JXB10_19160 [Pirellulales bacterium]|nr:hypothetical protein [Pirellulales bacterium]